MAWRSVVRSLPNIRAWSGCLAGARSYLVLLYLVIAWSNRCNAAPYAKPAFFWASLVAPIAA